MIIDEAKEHANKCVTQAFTFFFSFHCSGQIYRKMCGWVICSATRLNFIMWILSRTDGVCLHLHMISDNTVNTFVLDVFYVYMEYTTTTIGAYYSRLDGDQHYCNSNKSNTNTWSHIAIKHTYIESAMAYRPQLSIREPYDIDVYKHLCMCDNWTIIIWMICKNKLLAQ